MLNRDMINECLKEFNKGLNFRVRIFRTELNKFVVYVNDVSYSFDWNGNALDEKYNFISNDLERLFKAKLNSLDNSTVDAPNHYNLPSGKQLIDLLQSDLLTRSEFIGFCKGNVFKYVARYQAKNHREDLEKAKQYLNFLEDLEK